MVGIINDLVSKLKDIRELSHVQIWNSQFDYIEQGQSYSFPMPCAFVEVEPLEDYGQLGQGNQGVDLIIKIHIGLDFYNGLQFDDNLNIFALRDLVVKSLYGFKSKESGNMIKIAETQDTNHSNVYHYVITYKVHYVDTTTGVKEYYTVAPTNSTISHG